MTPTVRSMTDRPHCCEDKHKTRQVKKDPKAEETNNSPKHNVYRNIVPCWCNVSMSKVVSPLRLHSKATAFWTTPLVALLRLA